MKVALRFEGVRKSYGKALALDGLDLTVPVGVVCGLVGPNGAGKTTTYGIVGGYVRPDAGRIDVLGEGPLDIGRHRGRVSLLPQDCELNPHTPVRGLLAYLARLQGMGALRAGHEADRVLDLVGLRDRAKARTGQLSHGMRRRVAVAQAFLGEPELVLLDEPTSGLDPEHVVRLRDTFVAQRGKRTLIVSSHVLSELEAACDYIVFVERGRSTRAGPLAELTGQRSRLRIQLQDPPPMPALEAALPAYAFRWESDVLVVDAPTGLETAGAVAAVLPVLFAEGVRVVEVRRGRSLEEAYLDRSAAG